MEDVISFLQANYVWFIVGLVVILMTVVGYYAEKKGFSFGGKTTPKSNDDNDEELEEAVELKSLKKEEGIADIVRENTEEDLAPNYETEEEQNIEPQVEEKQEDKIDLEASNEDLYKPLSDSKDEEDINGIPEELYAPLGSTSEEKIELENVSPFSMETEESNEQVEDENSEYSRLFPSDPIIIGGEDKKEDQEEVAQEDLWNV